MWPLVLIFAGLLILLRGFVVTTEVKAGVRIYGLRPEMQPVVTAVESVWQRNGLGNPVITDAYRTNDPKKHGEGLALDYRINTIERSKWEPLGREISDILGPFAYDVVLEIDEGPQDGDRSHIHIEYDPKPYKSGRTTGFSVYRFS